MNGMQWRKTFFNKNISHFEQYEKTNSTNKTSKSFSFSELTSTFLVSFSNTQFWCISVVVISTSIVKRFMATSFGWNLKEYLKGPFKLPEIFVTLRSSHQRCFIIKVLLKFSLNSQENRRLVLNILGGIEKKIKKIEPALLPVELLFEAWGKFG